MTDPSNPLTDRRVDPLTRQPAFLLGWLGQSMWIVFVSSACSMVLDVIQILVLTAALFLLPSLLLGACRRGSLAPCGRWAGDGHKALNYGFSDRLLGGVSPVVAKLAVQDLARTGSTVGRIYAAEAVGSIVGTFAAGYVLIAQFGTHTIVWGYVIPSLSAWRDSPRMTFVLIAADTALDLSAIQASGEGESLAKKVLGEGEVRSLLAEGRTILLTDQYAPVEQMLAAVFRGETQ